MGFAGVIAGTWQRTRADKRAEWWRRATWAVDHTLSEDEDAQIVGFDVLTKLQRSQLISKEERDLFKAWGIPQALTDDNDNELTDNSGKEDS